MGDELNLGYGRGVDPTDRVVTVWATVERELKDLKERLERMEKLMREIAQGLGVETN